MNFDFTQNYFTLFGLPTTFALDRNALDATYRKLQTEHHPDRFATADDASKRLSLQIATQLNQGYQTLKSPLTRARYLLQLRGVDTQEETNTAMSIAFLMQQMAWREDIASAKATRDCDALATLGLEIAAETQAQVQALETLLDQQYDATTAAETVRKLRFLEKLTEEIDNAIDALTL